MKWLFLLFLSVNLMAQSVIDTSFTINEKIIYFANNQYKLSDSASMRIQVMTNQAEDLSNFIFQIDGYTDDVGSEQYNQKLSEFRCQAVKRKLLSLNVEPDHIHIRPLGESNLISDQQENIDRNKSRRVVIRLIKPRKMVKIRGRIVDSLLRKSIVTNITINARDYTATTTTDSAGKYSILAPFDEFAILHYNAKGYFFHSQRIKTKGKIIHEPIDIRMQQISIGAKKAIDNLLFHANTDVPLKSSRPTIEQIFNFLTINNETCIELAGHVNHPNKPPVKEHSFFMNLSILRALAIQKEMTDKNIDDKRILCKGYGNWEMLYPHATTEKHFRLNRRVELKVVACDSIQTIKDDMTRGNVFGPKF